MKKMIVSCGTAFAVILTLQGQSTFAFRNRPVDAPIFDAFGQPLAGANYAAELYGGATSSSLSPARHVFLPYERVSVPFLSGTDAGFFSTSLTLAIMDASPGGFAWLQVRAWDVRLGATYEDVTARGIGGYGESPLFYADGGDPTAVPPEVPAPLFGLESFSLRPIIPEPSTSALLAVGSVVIWMVRQRRRASGRGSQL